MSPRVVLITGANSGVGFATTKVLAEANKNFHIIMAGRSLDKVNKAMTDIQSTSIKGSLSTIHLDVIESASITKAAQYVETTYGKLDALINNASVANMDPDMKTRMEICMETNVTGSALVAEAFRPLLLKTDNPYSIYMSSALGSMSTVHNPYPYIDAYRVSKAALNMLMVGEWQRYGDKGLKCFSMCPGFVVSNLRGTSEEERSGGGNAKDPLESGRLVLGILEGKRDGDVGKFVHKDGVYPW